jgi:hypothetical protein
MSFSNMFSKSLDSMTYTNIRTRDLVLVAITKLYVTTVYLQFTQQFIYELTC